ncbi:MULTISPECIES: pyridoxamine 5'-phosphate oxidase family protein [unclassified Polaromonas]|uniref:pyridoxamine 5'-phosphate oxidase family protein n=1 Tax=unclassified Polaromonas TaxID=2638319 RepID=UPI000F088B3B|nr:MULTISPECIES: pyridoxamine 5'-phosphate oxidase family protein [unclassified Polaromonas]AYQ27288.1 flavin-nucleotide-binding protein [Polaromonas sp. SP1]QGJ17870.1 flavin-nucleotide-binding protein [Polaromonas sp. Pch-P]
MTTATFHEGERAVQARVGAAVRARMAEIGPRVIRDFMPDQHREFFEQLPFIVAGTVDGAGQPWASMLAQPPGFIHSPDAHHLVLRAQPLAGDPLQGTLVDGAPIGLLGLEPHTRRRNRMNGIVRGLSASGFAVEVSQSFGNCPKYIQAREPVYADQALSAKPVVHESPQLNDAARRMIELADTLFIATAYKGDDEQAGRAGGVDVSHRGGKPGFVRVDADGTLTMPDFFGNFFFNTLGNIAVNPRAGLLFADFDNGDLLYLAVTAEIIWDGPEVEVFTGAQRLLRFKVQSMRLVENSLPLRWGEAELSPVLETTGAWTV